MNLHLIKEKDYELTPYRGEELLRADLRSGKTGIRQSRPVFKKKKNHDHVRSKNKKRERKQKKKNPNHHERQKKEKIKLPRP